LGGAPVTDINGEGAAEVAGVLLPDARSDPVTLDAIFLRGDMLLCKAALTVDPVLLLVVELGVER
jgi:hypothetical protein